MFLVQDLPIMHTPLSVDIELGTLPHVHGEPKPPHQIGESSRVFIRCTSTTHVPTFSAIPIFKIQTCENASTLPSSNSIVDSDSVSDGDLPIVLSRVNALAHLTLSLA